MTLLCLWPASRLNLFARDVGGKHVKLGNCRMTVLPRTKPLRECLCFSTCYSVFRTAHRMNRFWTLFFYLFAYLCFPLYFSWCSHIYSWRIFKLFSGLLTNSSSDWPIVAALIYFSVYTMTTMKKVYINIIDVFVHSWYVVVIWELLLVVKMFLHVCLESLFFLIHKSY